MKAILKQKIKLPLISHWGIAGGNFVERVGLAALKQLDISVLQTYSFTKPKNNKLNAAVVKSYQEKYGSHRIFDTGIREWTIMGQAIGM